MKVILLKDVPKLGKKFDIKDVSDGHGRNFLIKNGLAELATEKSLRRAEEYKQGLSDARKREEAENESLVDKAEAISLSIKGRANEEGHLFASIKAEDVVEALSKQAGLKLPASFLKMEKPIKGLGEYSIDLVIGNKKGHLKLVVAREE